MAWELGVSNWAANMTYDTPQSLMDRIDDLKEPMTTEESYIYPATLATILLLHLIFIYQWNRRRTQKECLVSYRQLIQKKQYYRGILAILSHPPPLVNNNARQRGGEALSIDFGHHQHHHHALEGGQWWLQLTKSLFYLLTHGHLSGLPLLLYNSHLLWSCRALEPMFPSSWAYLRTLFSLAIVAMALEVSVAHQIVQKTTTAANASFGSIQPQFGADPILQTRKLILHRTMGTCSALLYAVLFLYNLTFPHVQVQVLPVISIPLYPWLSYLLVFILLGFLSWRAQQQHVFAAITSFMAGTMAGFLWMNLGFNFLGKLYWGTCLLLWVLVATLVSLKTTYPNMPGVEFVSWDAQGIIRNSEGVPVMESLLNNNNEQAEASDGEQPDNNDNDDDDNSIVDVENPLAIRGRVPVMNLDQDEEQSLLHPYSNRLIRRGGGSSDTI